MQSNSRRAFLTGRRVQRTPWEDFLSRLRRACEGRVHDFATAAGSARLLAGQASDVHHARALCAEYGVSMALDGLPAAARLDDMPVLWVEPGPGMMRHERLGPGDSRWFVQPGCLIGDLEQAGLEQFTDHQAPHLTVAAWLADRLSCDWDHGCTADSGLVHALVLLSDGTQANLGAFGVSNQKPLDNIRIQHMIPRLFELASGPAAGGLAAGPLWNGRYRLDALMPADGQTINLAHLLLGHGGELGWVEWLVLDARAGRPASRPWQERYGTRPGPDTDAREVDGAVRSLFDPGGLFPHPAQQYP